MNDTCSVSNKSTSVVAYTIPDMNLTRQFAAHETKKNISVRELEQLTQQPGGEVLLYNYLMVHDPEIISYLINGEVAPEYWLKEADIPNWMNNCTLDEFKDALDYAPEGTKDLIKQNALSMPLQDFAKRQAIKEQLGFDVTKALELTAEDKDEKATTTKAAAGRRTESSITPPAPVTEKKVVATTKETKKEV